MSIKHVQFARLGYVLIENVINLSNFQPTEFVGRGSETQFQGVAISTLNIT